MAQLRCPEIELGNGICNPMCNFEHSLWDLGDCCQPVTGDGLCSGYKVMEWDQWTIREPKAIELHRRMNHGVSLPVFVFTKDMYVLTQTNASILNEVA